MSRLLDWVRASAGVLALILVLLVLLVTLAGAIVTRARPQLGAVNVIEVYAEGLFLLGVAVSVLIAHHVTRRDP